MLPGKARRPGRAPVISLRQLALAWVAALALGAGACGDEDEAEPAEPADGETSLSVTLDPDGPDGKQGELTEEVSCEGGADDAACLAVAEIDLQALAPVSPNTACTEIYGGPDTASLEGTIDSEEVGVELNRGNGCEIERFEAAVPLLRALFPDYVPGGSLRP